MHDMKNQKKKQPRERERKKIQHKALVNFSLSTNDQGLFLLWDIFKQTGLPQFSAGLLFFVGCNPSQPQENRYKSISYTLEQPHRGTPEILRQLPTEQRVAGVQVLWDLCV